MRITDDILPTSGNRSLIGDDILRNLTSCLALPADRTSAAVRVRRPHGGVSCDENRLFRITGLSRKWEYIILNNLVVCGGVATKSDFEEDERTAGSSRGCVYLVYSNVTIARCDFINSLAENMGGMMFAVDLILHVSDTMFRNYEVVFMATHDDENREGAGGGIYVSLFVAWKTVSFHSSIMLLFLDYVATETSPIARLQQRIFHLGHLAEQYGAEVGISLALANLGLLFHTIISDAIQT